MSIARSLSAFALLAGLASAASAATVVNYAGLSPLGNGSPVTTFGSTAEVEITTRSFFSGPGLPTQAPHLSFWNSGYGTLPAAVYANSNGLGAEVTLTPIAGFSVRLLSFDLANFASRNVSATLLRVVEAQTGTVLWNGAGPNGLPVLSTFTLAPDVSSSRGLSLQWGYDWNVGMNFLTFDAVRDPGTSVIPVPPAVALFLGGLGLLGWAGRKRS